MFYMFLLLDYKDYIVNICLAKLDIGSSLNNKSDKNLVSGRFQLNCFRYPMPTMLTARRKENIKKRY